MKTQIRIAIGLYVLLAIIRKKLNLEISLHTILQVASVSLFEKVPLREAFSDTDNCEIVKDPCVQLNLFEL